MDGILDDQLYTHGRRQVNDHVTLAGQPVQNLNVADSLANELKVGERPQVSDVFSSPRRQVVDGDDLMPLTQQKLTQVASDEAGSAGD
jgi:hypothetical protein